MAHITFNFHSQVLDFHQTVHLLVPDANIYGALAGGADTEEIPVLYLLHGLKGAAHTWTSYTSIERYLYESEKKMVVVMPEMHNNFYTDQAIGWPYLKYVAEELPRIIERPAIKRSSRFPEARNTVSIKFGSSTVIYVKYAQPLTISVYQKFCMPGQTQIMFRSLWCR